MFWYTNYFGGNTKTLNIEGWMSCKMHQTLTTDKGALINDVMQRGGRVFLEQQGTRLKA